MNQTKDSIDEKQNIRISEVPTAIWIATLILTYEQFKNTSIILPWLKQVDIRNLAIVICTKKIDAARVSQWCNADHKNNTYNYLRAKGTLRRLTQVGELNGERERPESLPVGKIVTEFGEYEMVNLIDWYEKEYRYTSIVKEQVIAAEQSKNCINVDEKEYTPIVERVNWAIEKAWDVLSNKIVGELISINKEASLQLHFANILQQFIPLIEYEKDESISVELETGVKVIDKYRNIDVLVIITKGLFQYKIAIEMKCYKQYASSGGKRGAQDIFMKDVYFDLYLLENYQENERVNEGVMLIMTDYKNLVSPKSKNGKSWRYDVSQGAVAENITYDVPIGGKDINFNLKYKYKFDWIKCGEYYFLLMRHV